MRNLVTGGAGFIGSNLIDKLIKNGENVTCLDNFTTGNKINIRDWEKDSNFTLIEHDIINPINLEVDRIWHLACPASPQYYLKNPLETSKSNFLGTLNMLNLAKELNIKIFFASSSEVYGDPFKHPQDESYNGNVNPIGVRSCYEEGKRIAESLCFDYQRLFKTNICVARIFNTYGPKMKYNDGRVISNFINQALNNQPLTIYGNGNQTRSFCYIDDLVECLIKLMNSTFSGPINIGNDEEISINQLGYLINKKIRNYNLILKKDIQIDDPQIRKPDLNLIKRLINWEPETSLEEGLEKTIKYFMKNS